MRAMVALLLVGCAREPLMDGLGGGDGMMVWGRRIAFGSALGALGWFRRIFTGSYYRPDEVAELSVLVTLAVPLRALSRERLFDDPSRQEQPLLLEA